MDPVQLMMAAHQADATVAAQTPDQALQAAIAQSRPDLWAPLSTNPAAYPDLLGWLASTGNVEVLANLRARGYLTDDAAASAAGGAGDAGAAAADAAEEGADADDSGEAGDEQKTDEPAEDTEGAEDAEAEGPAPEDPHEDAAADESADEHSAEPAEAAEEPGTDEPAEDSEDVEDDEAENPAPEDPHVEDTSADADDGVPGTEGPAEDSEDSEDSEGAETATEPDAEPEIADEVAADADEAQESGTDQPEDEASEEQAAEEAAVDEAADSDNNDTTVLATASQWHEVDSADTTDVTASAQSAAVTSGWTAGSAAPAAGSAESVALPVPPPPSAEDIAAWAETPSGAPSGFSAAQPAVELDMFGPRMVAQMPPPQQQKRSSSSSTGRLVAIIVVLLLVIAGGGGVWAGNYFASKDKGGDSSRDRADTNGDEGGQQNNGQADAAATSTAAALPSGAVKACSSMPTFTITSVEDGQGELKVRGNVATACTEGDFLAGSSNQVLVYSSTSPTGGTDADHLVASGTFDLSSDPLIIPNGGRTVTLRFGEQHYFRTAKDLDLKRLSVRPSFDRGSPSSATSKSSTNSPMTIASSASSNANQEAQDEQAAGDAIQWQVKHDYPVVMKSMRGKWTPQLSTKQVGVLADGQTWTNRSILAEFLRTRQANPKAVIVSTSEWPVFDEGGWWVTLSGELYATADEANVWCDTQGYDRDHCLAKRMESSGSPQGTTKSR